MEAQKNFQAFGACERRLSRYARAPDPERDKRDPSWRVLQPTDLAGDDGEVSIFAVLGKIADPSGELYTIGARRRQPSGGRETATDD
jgi:hypothetical protein